MNRAATAPKAIALVVASAMFMAQLDGAVVIPAMPAMARSFSVRPIQLTIGITGYLMALLALLPATRWIADRFGARRMFGGAVAAFTLASVLCALSRSLSAFVAARLLQGAAAALMAPIGRIVLLRSTPKQQLLAAMTISTIPMLVAPALGPAVGGFITTYWSWPWIFLLNVPVGITGVGLVLRYIPRDPHTTRRPFDAKGFALLATASVVSVTALQQLAEPKPHWMTSGALLVLGVMVAVYALRHMRRHDSPVISLAPVRIQSFLCGRHRRRFLVRVSIRAMPFLLTMMLQIGMGYSAFRAGLLLLALSGGDLVFKPLMSATLRTFGFRTALMGATTLSALGLGLCAGISLATTFGLLFGFLLIMGMVRSVLFSALSALVFAEVPPVYASDASTLWNLIQEGTSVLGVSLSAVCLSVSARSSGEAASMLSLHDFHVAFVVMGTLGLTALVSLAKLPPDTGAEVSGHRLKLRAAASK